VLVCDDEPQIIRAVRVILRDGGYDVSGAGTIAEALEEAATQSPDAAIVDLILPDGNGIRLIRELRSWSTMPIVVLSALEDEEQTVLALQAGADDYLRKPFSARELRARLEALFRRVAHLDDAVLHVNGLDINLAARAVHRDGEEVRLTPTEFKLLRTLARNRGRLVTSRALLAGVWGTAAASDTALLRTHIANLRHKIERGGAAEGPLIATEPGLGYRFG
jgi:two-component system KDP operon response regulator KdpE